MNKQIVATLNINENTEESWACILGEQTPYPAPVDNVAMNPPEGYEFVTMIHFARHGSRYSLEPEHLPNLLNRFQYLAEQGSVTKQGKEILQDIRKFADWWSNNNDKLGHLTELGFSEHEAMGRRAIQMIHLPVQDKPSRTPIKIATQSSGVIRTLESQAAFLFGASQQAALTESPLEMISTDFKSHRKVTDPHSVFGFYDQYGLQSQSTRKSFFAQNDKNAPELIKEFSEQLITGLDKQEAIELVNILFELARQDAPQKGIRGMLKPFAQWAKNAGDKAVFEWLLTRNKLDKFYLFGAANYFEGFTTAMGEPILTDFMDAVEAAVANPDAAPKLNLRFGHDSGVLAFMNKLGLTKTKGSDTERMAAFMPCQQIPMAANICWQVYRKGSDVQIRMLHNEQPVSFPIEGYEGSELCRWESVKSFYQLK